MASTSFLGEMEGERVSEKVLMGALVPHGSRGLGSVPEPQHNYIPISIFLCCAEAWPARRYKILDPAEGRKKWPQEVVSEGP